MRYVWLFSIMLTFVFSTSALATPDPSLTRRENLLGSTTKYYYTYVTDVDNPGSYYRYIERQYVNTYSADTGKLVKTDRVLETSNHNSDPGAGTGWKKQVIFQKAFDRDEFYRKNRVRSARQEQKPKGVKMKLVPEGLVMERGNSRLTVKTKQSPQALFADLSSQYSTTNIGTIHRDRKNVYFLIRHDNGDGDDLHAVICVSAVEYDSALKGMLRVNKRGRAIVSTSGTTAHATASGKSHYSIQVKAVPLAETKEGFAIYNDLKQKGYLVYYYKAQVKGKWWMRVRVGMFPTIPEAQAFGETLKKKEGLDYVVTKAEAHIAPSRGEFSIIVTPSAIWMRNDTNNRELYRYSHYKIYTSDKPGNVSVVITDDGREGEIIHDYFTYTINLATGKKLPFQRKGAYKVHSEARFPAENRLVRIVADSSTYNQKTKRDTYNKLLILEHRDQEKIVKSILMKAHPGFEFSHFISHVHRGKTGFVVIQGRSTFALYDVKRDAFSGAVVPHRDQEVLGVDGRSGSLHNLKLSKDGRTLTGKVIHSGLFAYDLTVPGKPKRVYFKNNVETGE